MRSGMKRFVPMPIRSLPWRYRWMSGTTAYRAAPLTSIGKLARWTVLELLGREADFRTAEGCLLRSTSRNFTSLSLYITGQRDPELQAFIAKRLRPGSRFIDVGANIGAYTVFAGRLVGEAGRVLAIEAHPATFAYLADNVRRNTPANVTLLHCAVGAEKGTLRIVGDPANAGQTHVGVASEAGVTVPVETLDALAVRHGLDRVDYVKIDVEGFELPVLRGSTGLIRDNPDIVIQTELVPAHARRYGHEITDITALLTGLGLRPFGADARGEAVPLTAADIARHADILWMR